jgi:hypothetical protein
VKNMSIKQTMFQGLVTTDTVITISQVHGKDVTSLNTVVHSEQGRVTPMQVQGIVIDVAVTLNHPDADAIVILEKGGGGTEDHPAVTRHDAQGDTRHGTAKLTSAGHHLIEEKIIIDNDGIDGILPIAVVAAAVHHG